MAALQDIGTRRVTLQTRWYVIKEKGLNCDYDKRNISVVICDTDMPYSHEM